MKKCPVCGKGKARRLCARHGGVEVCSQCCAETRSPDCGDCVHYEAARQHQSNRVTRPPRKGLLPEGEFLIELSEEVEEAVSEALALGKRGKTDAAREILARVDKDHPRNHLICFAKGTLLAMDGEHEQAIEWFDRAIEIFPYMVEAHYNKATASMEVMDVASCIRSFRKVVQFGDRNDPDVMQAQSTLDTIASGLRESDGIGLDAFLAANDLFMEAFNHMQRGDWQQAAGGFRKVIALNERSVPSHGNLGMCLAMLGRKAEALAELDRALELDPAYQPARNNRRAALSMTEGQALEPAALELVEFQRGAP